VTNPSAGVWHYEYIIYNQNMDRAIQSFAVGLGTNAAVTNIGFHAPPQQPAWAFDGTTNNTGFSNAPWAQALTGNAMTWSTETFAQNPNANAVRWGTMYNFRFDSNRPPQTVNATIGFYKTGAPVTLQVQGPSSAVATQPVSVGGRVMTSPGQGMNRARVSISDGNGFVRTTLTNAFGYYNFENITPGVTYTLNIKTRLYVFASQTIQVNDNLSGVDFLPEP
jgi:Carboxypeptidase regulatory-like domain